MRNIAAEYSPFSRKTKEQNFYLFLFRWLVFFVGGTSGLSYVVSILISAFIMPFGNPIHTALFGALGGGVAFSIYLDGLKPVCKNGQEPAQ